MTMVEKVGLAIGAKVGQWLDTGKQMPLNEIARAAIEAMREPTPEMLNAMHAPDEHARIEWAAVIDAALVR